MTWLHTLQGELETSGGGSMYIQGHDSSSKAQGQTLLVYLLAVYSTTARTHPASCQTSGPQWAWAPLWAGIERATVPCVRRRPAPPCPPSHPCRSRVLPPAFTNSTPFSSASHSQPNAQNSHNANVIQFKHSDTIYMSYVLPQRRFSCTHCLRMHLGLNERRQLAKNIKNIAFNVLTIDCALYIT